ncbi:MAG: flagellar biosynthesis protein FlgN [Fervidobacterium sp.]
MLKENLEKEIQVLDDMIQAFEKLESSIISKDVEKVSKHSLDVEELSLLLGHVHAERESLLNNLNIRSVKDYIDMELGKDIEEVSLLAVRIVEKLNQLAIIMDGISQVIEFNNQYVELLNNLLKGVQSTTYDFSKSNQTGYSSGYSNGLYKQMEGNTRYDARK